MVQVSSTCLLSSMHKKLVNSDFFCLISRSLCQITNSAIQRVLFSIAIDQCSLKPVRMSYKGFAVTCKEISFEDPNLIISDGGG